MTQNGGAARNSLHYRAYLPRGIALAVVIPALSLPVLLVTPIGKVPSFLVSSFVIVGSILLVNVYLARDVVVSSDGRLTVTGLGQRIEVDVRDLTEINVSAGARWGFGFAHVRWNGGGFRMWPAMTYVADPRHKTREGRPYTSDDFRDLVYRLHLINPGMTIRGVSPPAGAGPATAPHPPHQSPGPPPRPW